MEIHTSAPGTTGSEIFFPLFHEKVGSFSGIQAEGRGT